MATPFDFIASKDGSVFKQDAIGHLQRKLIWHYLEDVMHSLPRMEILELNVGSGDDVEIFSEKGFNVVATDLSEETSSISQQSSNRFSLQSRVSSQYLDLETFDKTLYNKKFDLIFSNVDVVNQFSPETFKRFLQKLPCLLAPGGRLVMVVMPTLCLWESAYSILRLKFRKAFNRTTDTAMNKKPQWYYSPAHLVDWTRPHFRMIRQCPIGFMLPPTSLGHSFNDRPKMLSILYKIEKRLKRMSFLSNMSYYFVIDLQLR